MKTLIFLGEEYNAEKIIKTGESIIGKYKDTEVFSFKGIKDFSLFKLKDGAEFDTEEKTEELLLKEIAKLKIEIIQLKRGTI